MQDNRNILVVGTGTIGEPLIALLSRMKDKFNLSEIIFHKRTPLDYERPKVNSLVEIGAKLSVNESCMSDFEKLGHSPDYTYEEAISKSSVVIDCTPEGNGNKNSIYKNYKNKFFIAQGSEKGFGKPYALGINDGDLKTLKDPYVQVVSCNTHSIARILTSLTKGSVPRLIHGDFACLRRANDVSQVSGFTPALACEKHTDEIFGTHHARDVNDLFNYRFNLPIFSSAVKSNTQYMHTVRFSLTIDEEMSRDEVLERLRSDKYVSTTKKKSTNTIFSFGRDHGFYGRIYTQTVICEPTLFVKNHAGATRITGFAFTPQDGNSLMSSVAASLFAVHGQEYEPLMKSMDSLLVKEV